MALFGIDPEKCKRDGICVAECPVRIIEMKDRDETPRPVEGADALCIRCGHCVAVCPHGALSHKDIPLASCPPVEAERLPSLEDVERLMRARRSIRSYRDKPVDRDTLKRLIDIAGHAPSGHNLRPVSWRVIYDTEEVRKLSAMVIDWMQDMRKTDPRRATAYGMDLVVGQWEAGVEMICRGAPHLIIAHANKSLPPAQPACVIAMAHLELAAAAEGLGACWAGYFNTAAALWPPLAEALALPKGHDSFGTMMIGHPQYRYKRVPPRKTPEITWGMKGERE